MEKSMPNEDAESGPEKVAMLNLTENSPVTPAITDVDEDVTQRRRPSVISVAIKGVLKEHYPPLQTAITTTNDQGHLVTTSDQEKDVLKSPVISLASVKNDPEEVEPGGVIPSSLVAVKMEMESDDDYDELKENDNSEEFWSASSDRHGKDSEEDEEDTTEPVTFIHVKEEPVEEEDRMMEHYDENEYESELQEPVPVSLQIIHDQKSEEGIDPLDLTVRRNELLGSTPLSGTGNAGHGSYCPHCGLLFVDDLSVSLHAETCLQTLRNKRFKCETCGIAVSSAASLRRHKQTHTGKRPHKCDICGASFKRLSHLRDHKSSHTGEKKHVCATCGTAFTQLSNLRTHERHHVDDSSPRVRRLFRCEICGAEFSYNSSLKMHLLNHTGERPYECDICHSSFKQLQSLTVHKRRHTGERPFQCDTCGSTFAHLQGLRVHKRIHTGERPYKCDVCDAAFTQLHSLSTHKRRHDDVRPYSCDVCNASFVTKDKMRYHIRIHTGEKPYSCPICGKAFTTASDVTRHKRIHVPKVKTENVSQIVEPTTAASDFDVERKENS